MLLSFIQFILICLLAYMFFRLLCVLYKKGILKDIDIFFVTSNPWEYKKHIKEIEKNSPISNKAN